MFKRQFIADKNLLNPKFDGYKLSPIIEQDRVTRTKLPCEDDLRFKKFSTNHRLGFRDLQARVRLNHLTFGGTSSTNNGSAFYVDLEFKVMRVIYNKEARETQFQPLVQLIQPLGNLPNYSMPSETLPFDPYPPSLIILNSELLLASNGVGNIELVHINSRSIVVCARYDGDGTEGISPVPCVLLAARLVADKIVMIVYSRVAVKNTQFNITALEMTIDGGHLKVLHVKRGPEVPVYSAITKSGASFIYGSESPYEDFTIQHRGHSEHDPIEIDTMASREKPCYAWTQDGADITVQFSVARYTEKTSISCQFNRTHLSLIVRGQDVSYPFRKLWSTVYPDNCTWTLESNGTLTLFLNKQDKHTRWPHLFDVDDNITETLDPARLAEITERMEKFTSNDVMNNPSVINPVATDMDEDIDDKGEPIRFAIYDRRGHCTEEIYSGGCEWLCGAFDCEDAELPSTCVKVDIDGQVYSFQETNGVNTRHKATFDAFAFVQASKRDSRFTYYDPKLKFIVIVESSRNAYIYYHHGDKRSIEPQALVDLTQGEDVNVLGCQLLFENVLMVLTETEVITIDV